MNRKIKIQAVCSLNNSIFPCSGFIEILRVEAKEAYASWQIFDERGSNIAGVSQNYYMTENPCARDKLVEMILTNIKNFRISRKRLFSDVKVIENESVISGNP